MKKIVIVTIVFLLALSFSACSGTPKAPVNIQSDEQNPTEQTLAQNESEPKEQEGAIWPEEFTKWDVPTMNKAKVVSTADTSVSGGVITQGVNITVNLKDVSKANFDAYCEELTGKGYTKSPDSLPDIMLFYEKSVDGGIIKLTLSYSEEGTTIIANNSAAAAKKAENPGKTQWPQSAKDVPEFTKAKYKETVEIGGGMYAITFTGVSAADLDWYRTTLKKAGFERDESSDTETYGKLNGNTIIGVGFDLSGDVLQIMIMNMTD
jgi:hypothetical protein